MKRRISQRFKAEKITRRDRLPKSHRRYFPKNYISPNKMLIRDERQQIQQRMAGLYVNKTILPTIDVVSCTYNSVRWPWHFPSAHKPWIVQLMLNSSNVWSIERKRARHNTTEWIGRFFFATIREIRHLFRFSWFFVLFFNSYFCWSFSMLAQCACHHHGCRAGVCHSADDHRQAIIRSSG